MLVSGAVVVCFAVEAAVLGVTIFLSVETEDVVVLVLTVVKFFIGPVDTPPVVAGVVEEIVTADGDKNEAKLPKITKKPFIIFHFIE